MCEVVRNITKGRDRKISRTHILGFQVCVVRRKIEKSGEFAIKMKHLNILIQVLYVAV